MGKMGASVGRYMATIFILCFSGLSAASADCTLDCRVQSPSSPYYVFTAGMSIPFIVVPGPSGSCTTIYNFFDFGDGTAPKDGTSNNFTHTYSNPGFYDWTYRAYENKTGGAQCTKTGTYLIVPADCSIPSCTATATTEPSGPTVTFSASATLGNCAPATGVHYRWYFGDGVYSEPSEQGYATHTYAATGTYSWSLTVGVGPEEYVSYQKCEKSGTIVVTSTGCSVSCTATVPASGTAGSAVAFAADATPVSCTGAPAYAWTFGDGETSGEQNPSHVYYNTGNFPWTLTVTVGGKACTKSGSISISNCAVGCSATAPGTATVGSPANFSASATATGCTGEITYAWDFGDTWTSTLQNPTHTYTSTGTFGWTMTATAGGVECRKAGSITVGCLTVGSLSFCSDSVSQSGNTYTLSGNVQINNRLFFTGTATYTGIPANGTGTLVTSDDVYVKLSKGNETILRGPGLSFDVDGSASTLYPTIPDPNFAYANPLAQIRMFVNGLPIRISVDGVRTESTFYVGTPGGLTIAQMKAIQLYPFAGQRTLLSAEVVNGELTPSITALKMAVTYDPTLDKLEGTLSVAFPFLGTWSVDAAIRIQAGCFNGFDISVGLPNPIPPPPGIYGLGFAGFTLKVDNICLGENNFTIFFGGDLAVVVPPPEGIPAEYFSIKEVGLRYNYPYTAILQGGTLTFLGYPLGGASGTLRFKPPALSLRVYGNIADVLRGELRLSFLVDKVWYIGRYSGSFQIPDFSCGWANIPCRTVKSMISSAVTLPYFIQSTELETQAQYNLQDGSTYAFFKGTVSIGSFRPVVLYELQNGTPHLTLGTGYDNLFNIFRSQVRVEAATVQCSLVLPSAQDNVVFAVAGASSVPAIRLQTPQGDILTPQDVGSHPGVVYFADSQNDVAFFQVMTAGAGTWTLMEDNLPESDASFVALAAHASPVTAFTGVSENGNTVSVSLSVSPASSTTFVALYWARAKDGSAEGLIARRLPATTGAASTTWDTSDLPTGTYYLMAKTDDGMNAPVTTFYADAIQVDHAGIAPPTHLSGTRDGDTVTLTWSPSTSPGVAGYNVLYTDAPDVPGYTYFAAAVSNGGLMVSGLDPALGYRFCAVAMNSEGQTSLESNAVTFPKPGSTPGDCDGDGTISIGEVQKAINMFLGTFAPGCGVDCNGDGTVSIGEVQKVINGFLGTPGSC